MERAARQNRAYIFSETEKQDIWHKAKKNTRKKKKEGEAYSDPNWT